MGDADMRTLLCYDRRTYEDWENIGICIKTFRVETIT